MKKTDQIAIHMDADKKAQAVALANLAGVSVSEWAESLIDRELGEQLRHYECIAQHLRQCDGTERTVRTPTDWRNQSPHGCALRLGVPGRRTQSVSRVG